MSKSYASDYTSRQRIDYRTRSPIQADDWIDLADHQNSVFQANVGELGAHVFDPRGETTSDILTQTNTNTSRNANFLNFGGVLRKKIGTGDVRFALQTHGADVRIDCTLVNEESGSTLATLSNTHPSTSDERTSTVDVAEADVEDGSGNPQFISAKIEWLREPSSGTGFFFYIRVGGDYLLPVSELPTDDATP